MDGFRFERPRPKSGVETVTRFWRTSSGRAAFSTERYGPDGRVGAPAPVDGTEISEQEYADVVAERRARRRRVLAEADVEFDRLLGERRKARVEKLERLAKKLGVDVADLEGLI